jgi:iron complex outermembrane receptor protein
LKNSELLTYLKARGGFGVTGQQDIYADYPYIANYQEGSVTAQYLFGNQYFTPSLVILPTLVSNWLVKLVPATTGTVASKSDVSFL